ncbi:hypothetical protein D3C87_1933150 [compost metagenome]
MVHSDQAETHLLTPICPGFVGEMPVEEQEFTHAHLNGHWLVLTYDVVVDQDLGGAAGNVVPGLLGDPLFVGARAD